MAENFPQPGHMTDTLLNLVAAAPLAAGIFFLPRRDQPRLPKIETHQEDEKTIQVMNYLEGMNLYFSTDYEPDLHVGSFMLEIETTPEYPGTNRGYQTDAKALYDEKGILQSFQSSRFFGYDSNAALEAGADALAQSNWAGAMLLQYATLVNLPMSAVTNDSALVSGFYKGLLKGITEYERTTAEPNVEYSRVKNSNLWNVSFIPRDPSQRIKSEEEITTRHSLGNPIAENGQGIRGRWRDKPQLATYFVKSMQVDRVPTLIFETQIPQTIMVEKIGFQDILLIRRTQIPAHIHPEKAYALITNRRKKEKNFRRDYPIALLKP